MIKELRTRILAMGQMAPTMGALHERGVVGNKDFELYCQLLLDLEALDKTLKKLGEKHDLLQMQKGAIVSIR